MAWKVALAKGQTDKQFLVKLQKGKQMQVKYDVQRTKY